jgi:response regulator RpfG family c-di-GMP phosphodiesterase
MKDNTILIIEDDKTNMCLIRSVLALGKGQILEAENAEKHSASNKERIRSHPLN